jgi:hypothetical protein
MPARLPLRRGMAGTVETPEGVDGVEGFREPGVRKCMSIPCLGIGNAWAWTGMWRATARLRQQHGLAAPELALCSALATKHGGLPL